MILDSGKTVFAACLAKISEWLNDWMKTFHFLVNLDTILQPNNNLRQKFINQSPLLVVWLEVQSKNHLHSISWISALFTNFM